MPGHWAREHIAVIVLCVLCDQDGRGRRRVGKHDGGGWGLLKRKGRCRRKRSLAVSAPPPATPSTTTAVSPTRSRHPQAHPLPLPCACAVPWHERAHALAGTRARHRSRPGAAQMRPSRPSGPRQKSRASAQRARRRPRRLLGRPRIALSTTRFCTQRSLKRPPALGKPAPSWPRRSRASATLGESPNTVSTRAVLHSCRAPGGAHGSVRPSAVWILVDAGG